ncbi:MAG: FIST C-terminal domain-containing protein [Ghiorsea sp.]
MNIQSFTHSLENGWSVDVLPAMDSKQTLVLVFGAREYFDQHAALLALGQAYPLSAKLGCSTSGEIHGDEVNDASLSVSVVQFEKTTIKIASSPIASAADSKQVGESLANEVLGDALKNVLVLSEGLNINGDYLVEGLNTVLSSDTKISGGLAGDADQFESTWIWLGDKPQRNTVAVAALYGDAVQVSCATQAGWDVFGPWRRVTKSVDNVLYELDGQPALELYKRYLGDQAVDLPASGLLFPLSIRQHVDTSRCLVRTVLAIDEEAGSMTFAGNIPENCSAQLMQTNYDNLIQGAHQAAQALDVNKESEGEYLAIAVSCVGRRLVMGARAEEELEATLEALPDNTHQVGFYSYGEIAPQREGKCSDLHNQTMTLTLLSERV